MAMICEIDELPPGEYHISSRKTTGIGLLDRNYNVYRCLMHPYYIQHPTCTELSMLCLSSTHNGWALRH